MKSVGGTAIPTNARGYNSLSAYQKEGNQSMANGIITSKDLEQVRNCYFRFHEETPQALAAFDSAFWACAKIINARRGEIVLLSLIGEVS